MLLTAKDYNTSKSICHGMPKKLCKNWARDFWRCAKIWEREFFGRKISAVKHVEYINREGTFAHDELWKQTNKFVGNFITTAQMPNALDGLNALLYKTDDFGSIKNSERGIEVTEKFSHTTIAIALMLADKALNHQPLIINGSPDFHKTVMEVALQDNLIISFKDKLMQDTFELRKQIKEKKEENSSPMAVLLSPFAQKHSPVFIRHVRKP